MAEAAAGTVGTSGLRLVFRLPRDRWVDLDTLVESTLAGLRDAGALGPRFAGLDAVLATRTETSDRVASGVSILPAPFDEVLAVRPPGGVRLDVSTETPPAAGRRDSKVAWRHAIAAAWGSRPLLEAPVWADVSVRGGRALTASLEVCLDALEPVVGRDPRGRSWQEFFPNDHVITWLRVALVPDGPALRLRLGRAVRTARG